MLMQARLELFIHYIPVRGARSQKITRIIRARTQPNETIADYQTERRKQPSNRRNGLRARRMSESRLEYDMRRLRQFYL